MKGWAPLPSVIFNIIIFGNEVAAAFVNETKAGTLWSRDPDSRCSPPQPRATQGQQNALVLPAVMGPQELCRPPNNPGRRVGGPAAFVRWPVFSVSILPSSLRGQQHRYHCPAWLGSRRQRAFLSEFHGLIRCWRLFPPGTWKPSFVSCRRVRLSPAFWQQASVCLQQGLLRGGREGRRGRGEEGKFALKAILGVGGCKFPPVTQQESGACKRAAPHKESPPTNQLD